MKYIQSKPANKRQVGRTNGCCEESRASAQATNAWNRHVLYLPHKTLIHVLGGWKMDTKDRRKKCGKLRSFSYSKHKKKEGGNQQEALLFCAA